MANRPPPLFYAPTALASYFKAYEADEDSITADKKAQIEDLQKKGMEHERKYLAKLRDEGKKIAKIPENCSFKQKVERTRFAMKKGYDVIYQAALSDSHIRGYADFLIKCSTPSVLGNYSYEVLDTKLTSLPKPKHIIQICAYSMLLSKIQKHTPEKMYLVLGDNEKISYQTNDFLAYFRHIKHQFEKNEMQPDHSFRCSGKRGNPYELKDLKLADGNEETNKKNLKIKIEKLPFYVQFWRKIKGACKIFFSGYAGNKSASRHGKGENEYSDRDEKLDLEKYKFEAYFKELVSKHSHPQALNILLANLLEFHWREDKAENNIMKSWQKKSLDELINDVNCLAGLKRVRNKFTKDGFAYKFSNQECKLAKGTRVMNIENLESIGVVTEIKNAEKIVILEPLKSGKIPRKLSIAAEQTDSGILSKSIYSYADKVLDNEHGNSAITDFLNRTPPRIKEHEKKIARQDQDKMDLFQTIENLDNSYLFIQGPPGTGKTHVSGEIIIELLRRKKRIGISSNSHKAINNLLAKIEEFADSKEIPFAGVKRVTEQNADSYFQGKYIKNDDSINSIKDDIALYAGTAWLFAEMELENESGDELDYLFVDEAGQVPLANLVAMSGIAKNIILMGDQMQLSPPIKADHPGDSGLSALDFLIQGESIIDSDYGFFLDTTRRLHPSICNFASDTFYNAGLKPHEITKTRYINSQNPTLPSYGIHILPVNHYKNIQKSVEEAKVIKNKYNEILGQPFHDGEEIRHVTEDDILVVAPYNAQVNYLKSQLPEGARIGTVDKFQGQEAPVVLISMTTSDTGAVQYILDFLYDPNRLNVAISRAQCLAILVMSPNLLKPPIGNIEFMKSVNIFCLLNEYVNSHKE